MDSTLDVTLLTVESENQKGSRKPRSKSMQIKSFSQSVSALKSQEV